jgi:hypothetical protein
MLDINQLHQSLFGYVPDKPGTAYERIGAVVLAMLGWGDVIHDSKERPAKRQAIHQLDITAHDCRRSATPAGGMQGLEQEGRAVHLERTRRSTRSDVSVGGARVLHRAGRGAAAAASVGRSSSHSEAVT